MIRTEGLTKVYDGNTAVDSLDLSIEKGDIFGFLGPNGAGKSTTIFMLAGLIEPTVGKAYIRDIEIAKNPMEIKEMIGLLPENVGFYENLTAEQNLDYFGRFYGMSAEKRAERVNELLKLVDLGDVEQKLGGYSKGMRQRLGIAQALLNDPDIIFLDEPTGGLDPEGTHEFRGIIKKLEKEEKTIFFSSHILSEVKQVCKTIGIISKGRLIAQGTPRETQRELKKGDTYRIAVETIGKIPDLPHGEIVAIEYDGNKAVLEASKDIRDDISAYLFDRGVKIRSMMLDEPSLEEIYLKTVRGE
ncbi:MAG: ABC transporter ATP-binding protein [Euryarchaeota archaeon]|nr:ABC transporter ATP-binding protein [Euryarchaeota archaeon]